MSTSKAEARFEEKLAMYQKIADLAVTSDVQLAIRLTRVGRVSWWKMGLFITHRYSLGEYKGIVILSIFSKLYRSQYRNLAPDRRLSIAYSIDELRVRSIKQANITKGGKQWVDWVNKTS